MAEWIRSALDLILIAMVGLGLYQAARLIKHLAGLRQGRVEMERFVHEFNATVIRAEAGIKGLRNAARDSGDDLEKLVEKAMMLRDELTFIVESADQIAERLSQTASNAVRPEVTKTEKQTAPPASVAAPAAAKAEPKVIADVKPQQPAVPPVRLADSKETSQPASRAEKELLQALQKLS